MPELPAPLSCPFCGRFKVVVQRTEAIYPWLWWVRCQVCGGRGPALTVEAEAILAWNGALMDQPELPEHLAHLGAQIRADRGGDRPPRRPPSGPREVGRLPADDEDDPAEERPGP